MRTSPRSILRSVAAGSAVLVTMAALGACAQDSSVALDSVAVTATSTVPQVQTTVVAPTTTTTGSTQPVPDTGVPDTAGAGAGIDFPTGADDVVLKIQSGIGGFRTFQSNFAAIPALLVTGDGRVFTEGPVTMIFPGPFLPNLQVASVNRAALSQLMESADAAGLLGEIPDYTVGQPQVTDVGSTALTLTANGKTYVHEAYALGMEPLGTEPLGTEPGDSPARKALRDFIESAKAQWSMLPSESYVPDTYLLATQPADITPDTTVDPATGDPQPRLQLWPSEIGIDLKDLTCAPVASSKVQALFEKADQMTFFVQDGVVYSLAVRPVFPGQPGCEALK